MHWTSTQSIIDYTTVPLGLRIEGQVLDGPGDDIYSPVSKVRAHRSHLRQAAQ